MSSGDRKQAVRTRRTRRSTREVIDRILAAAVTEFGEHGFSGARTAAIAQRAGVVEALLFKHFDSKEGLFQQAIFTYLDTHFTRFSEEHRFEENDDEGRLSASRDYIEAQQDFLRRHSRMFRSLFANEAFGNGDEPHAPMLSGLQDYLDKMVGIVEARSPGAPESDTELTARISFATVLACTVFRDLLFPAGIADEEKIRAAVAEFVMEGAKASIR